MQWYGRKLSADSIDPLYVVQSKKSLHSTKSVSFDQHNPHQGAYSRKDHLTLEAASDMTNMVPIIKTCTSICKSLRENLRIAHSNEEMMLPTAIITQTIKVARSLPTNKSTVRTFNRNQSLYSLDTSCFQVGIRLSATIVESLVLGGSAHVSGEIQLGDQIIEIDGKSVTSSSEIYEKLCGCDIPGTHVSVLIRRADMVSLYFSD
jgi:C-terminal processing protease CtpA/Prc